MSEQETTPTTWEETPEGHKAGFVSLVGRPNAGKSTLFNAFMRQKLAIVTPSPQTTRNRQLGIVTQPDYQVIFVDTPGLMKPRHKLDEYMVNVAAEALKDADVVVWVVDASEEPGTGDEIISRQLAALGPHTPVILAMNKADRLTAEEVLPRTEAFRALLPNAPWILFSATEGNGRDELWQMILNALPEGPRYYPADQITDLFIRDLAAELIREQIMLQLREEVPYGTAVVVDEFKERENGVIYISANIFVERDSHKRILIGAKGKQLQQIGTAARQEIETLTESKVFLDLWVKVEPKWRRDEKALRRLGYSVVE
ncbi:MAG: GTPase Era [Anaerolineales bacterium]|nr:GTPase Era [Anaerolineales bacterium]